MASEDISALRQILEVKLDSISTSLHILNSKIEVISQAQSAQHDKILKAEFSIERLVEDLKVHQDREKEYDMGLSTKIDANEKSIDGLKMKVLKITTTYSTAIAIAMYLIEKFILK